MMQNFLKFRRFLTTARNTIGKHKYEQIVSVETEIYSPTVNNNIYYRGYSVRELAKNRRFLDTFYLLLNGEFPSRNQNQDFITRIITGMKTLPGVITDHNKVLPEKLHVCDFLTSSWSLMNLYSEKNLDSEYGHIFGQCLGILWLRYLGNVNYDSVSDDPVLRFSVNLLFKNSINEVDHSVSKLLNALFTLYMDHGLTSASYNSRVCISEGGSTFSGLISAVSTHKYALDTLDSYLFFNQLGPEKLDYLLSEFDSDRTLKFPLDEITFPKRDPRTKILTDICKDHFGEDIFSNLSQIESRLSNRFYFKFDIYVFELIKRLCKYSEIAGQVDSTDLSEESSLSYCKGIRDRVSTVLTLSRIAGWLSHICEQRKIGRRIEHIAAYIGVPPRLKVV